MPIRPENRERYPPNWPAISLDIRTRRAAGQCECQGKCGLDHNGRCAAVNGQPNPRTGSTVVLTVAHLNHEPADVRPENLLAACQQCHLRYDAQHHRETAATTRRAAVEAAGQLTLALTFPTTPKDQQMHLPPGYYAVPDPTSAEPTMTYWHVADEGGESSIAAWPSGARYGPQLLRKDVPRAYAAKIAVYEAFAPKRAAFHQQIRTALAQDPAACAARYAEFNTRCFVCARSLRADPWRLLGIGRDCCRNAGLNPSALAAMVTPRIATAHALHHALKAQAAAAA